MFLNCIKMCLLWYSTSDLVLCPQYKKISWNTQRLFVQYSTSCGFVMFMWCCRCYPCLQVSATGWRSCSVSDSVEQAELELSAAPRPPPASQTPRHPETQTTTQSHNRGWGFISGKWPPLRVYTLLHDTPLFQSICTFNCIFTYVSFSFLNKQKSMMQIFDTCSCHGGKQLFVYTNYLIERNCIHL